MAVITRFAPSPTGYLHIGSARTALFNWLYAKANNGTYLLRIEDTDKARSTDDAIDAISNGLEWLGLTSEVDPIFQSKLADRHIAVVEHLLSEDKAYKCYATKEELDTLRAEATANKQKFRYDGRWRDRAASEAPEGIAPTIRLKVRQEGEFTIDDKVQGKVTIGASELDDMVLLRSDGTPTYMLAVVVDDHDMGITHVIRGDDHFTNSFRQAALYEVLGWQLPVFAHIPLIHGEDGTKLSKRHGALGVDAYRDMGILPEAMCNYLLRLGWSHGDDEIISQRQAIEWFNLESIGKSPARFDLKKLYSLNAHYLKQADNNGLLEHVANSVKKQYNVELSNNVRTRLSLGMDGLKDRSKTLNELVDMALFYIDIDLLELTQKAQGILDGDGKDMIQTLLPQLEQTSDWSHHNLEVVLKQFTETQGIKLGKVAGAIRAALTKSHISPSVFDIMTHLGKQEVITRLEKIL